MTRDAKQEAMTSEKRPELRVVRPMTPSSIIDRARPTAGFDRR